MNWSGNSSLHTRLDIFTQSALLRVQNDLLHAIDSSKRVILSMLDLSAAFDTDENERLLRELLVPWALRMTL